MPQANRYFHFTIAANLIVKKKLIAMRLLLLSLEYADFFFVCANNKLYDLV